jgi:hypothetical protein
MSKKTIVAHLDCEPGLVMDDVQFEYKTNCDGESKYWKVTQPIGYIFGASADGEITAYGKTKEIARKRLAEERHKLYESLWV